MPEWGRQYWHQAIVKKICDSIIMSQGSTQLVSGTVYAFVSHSAPGYDPAPEHQANIADVVKLSAQSAQNQCCSSEEHSGSWIFK
jgi:hypothetical protein